MSVPMKTHHTKRRHKESVVHLTYHGIAYAIPKAVLQKYVEPRKQSHIENVSAKDVFASLDEAHTKPGVLLKGLRSRENLTQVQFAEKIGVTQTNLSSMENGHRPIGKEIAKRIASVFHVDYRYFLA